MLEAYALGQQFLATVNANLTYRGLMLTMGTVVFATLIAAPSSPKNDKGERPELHQTKRGKQWLVGMKTLFSGSFADVRLPRHRRFLSQPHRPDDRSAPSTGGAVFTHALATN